MKHRSVPVALAAAALLAAGLTACSSGGSGGDSLTLGLVIPQGDKYFQSIQSGLEKAAKADGNTVVVVNSNNDASAEATAVQNLIQRRVDVILMQPATSSAGSIATMKSVKAAKIPLICYGNCTADSASKSVVDGVVQSDNTKLGTATGDVAAKYIEEKLGGKATIGILNCDSFETCKLRKSGFKEALSKAGIDATYAADQEGFLADKATPIATNMMSANPSIDLLWSANEGGTVGEVTAVSAGSKKIPVFGTDISDQLGKFLLDDSGPLQATTGQDGEGTAKRGYQMALTAVEGKKNSPFEVLVPGTTFTRDDPDAVNEFLGK